MSDLTNNSEPRPRFRTLLAIAAWFAIITGLVEGAVLLVFQRLNWASWGPMMHVSREIFWISPIVDLAFFVLLTSAVALLCRFIPRIPPIRALMAVLTAAAVYDWLTATSRLTHWSSLLLAIGIGVAFARWIAKREAGAGRFTTRTLPYVTAVAVVVFAAIQGGQRWQEHRELAALPSATPGSPNVLIIVIDTLRADRLSSYGYSRITSPNIDRLASQGVLFENAIAPCSWSYPSHVSLLTGRYQYEHGIGNVPPMHVFGPGPQFGPTLGEAFEAHGYRTAAFSANRTYFSRDLGFGRGFTHFEDYFHSPADSFVRTVYGREFARIYLVRSDKSKPKRLLRWLHFDSLLDPDEEGSAVHGGAMGVRKRASVVNTELLDWIDRGPRQHPFFAFINYFDVHSPYGGPYGYKQAGWAIGSESDKYDEGIEYVDDMLGRLMSELSRRGLADNTMVVITSDHGESLGQHGLSAHGSALYRELIRVPLIFWYPGHLPAGIRIPTPVSNAAIASTLMTELGFHSKPFPVVSLEPLWSSNPPKWPDPVSELAQNDFTRDRPWENKVPTANSGPMKSLVEGEFHLIVHKQAGGQLYDWEHDLGEADNLIDTPAGQQTAQEMMSRLEAQMGVGANSQAEPAVRAAAHSCCDPRQLKW